MHKANEMSLAMSTVDIMNELAQTGVYIYLHTVLVCICAQLCLTPAKEKKPYNKQERLKVSCKLYVSTFVLQKKHASSIPILCIAVHPAKKLHDKSRAGL
jgi:hypothetical protein